MPKPSLASNGGRSFGRIKWIAAEIFRSPWRIIGGMTQKTLALWDKVSRRRERKFHFIRKLRNFYIDKIKPIMAKQSCVGLSGLDRKPPENPAQAAASRCIVFEIPSRAKP